MLDLDVLQATAENAKNWGGWAIWEDLNDGGFVHVGNEDGVIPPGEIATPDDAEANPIAQCFTREIAAHVVAFDPPTVLGLIAELRQARAERDVLAGLIAERDARNRAIRAELDGSLTTYESNPPSNSRVTTIPTPYAQTLVCDTCTACRDAVECECPERHEPEEVAP